MLAVVPEAQEAHCLQRSSFGLCLALASLLVASSAQAESQIRFLLIPQADFHGEQTDPARFLADGEVRLYRPGEYKPRLIAQPNEPIAVPAGQWLWIAEAPGWVSVEAGVMALPATEKVETRTVVNLLVPACQISLGDRRHWPGTERVDFVSLDHGVTYPLPLDFRTSVRVPAGRWLSYSVGARGLIGITKPRPCAAGQELHLKTIAPPNRDSEEWMVHVETPEGLRLERQEFQVMVRPPVRGEGSPVHAAAAVWTGRRGTFFLFDLPAGSERQLAVAHPSLRSFEQDQAVAGGRAREFGPVALRPRRQLTVTVDYRPQRRHQKELLVLVDCGDGLISAAEAIHPKCAERGRIERPLRRGLAEYHFDKLDDRQYRLDAEVDGEVVWGLGENLTPRLDPASDEPPGRLQAQLVEFHVYGHLLERGEPVPGELRLFKEGNVPWTRYPTDEDLTYHLYYFGYSVTPRWFTEKVAARIPAGSKAMPPLRYLSACSDDGRCRVLNSLSAVIGQGRWDIDLGSGSTIEFRSLDSATGKVVPEATVVFERTPSVFFVEGKVFEYLDPQNFMPNAVSTGPTGNVLVRWPGAEKAWYGARKPGYAEQRGEFQPLPGEVVTVEIPLQPEVSASGGLSVRLRGGGELAKAFFLVVDAAGVRQPCSRASSSTGWVSFPANCLVGRRVVVIHPAAALQILDGEALRSAAEVVFEPAPQRPASVRVVDRQGRAVADLAVELRLPELRLTLNDFYLASSLTGQPLGFGRTDSQGTVQLPTLDPRVWGPAEALITLGEQESAVEVEPGRAVLLSLP